MPAADQGEPHDNVPVVQSAQDADWSALGPPTALGFAGSAGPESYSAGEHQDGRPQIQVAPIPRIETDADFNKGPSVSALISQAGIDASGFPAACFPQSVPNLMRTAAAVSLSFGGPADNVIPVGATESNQAALPANLQLNMPAMGQGEPHFDIPIFHAILGVSTPAPPDLVRSADAAPNSASDSRESQQQIPVAPTRYIETHVELVAVNVSYGRDVQPPSVLPQNDVHPEATAPSALPPVDSHSAHPHEAAQSASDQQPQPTLPVIPGSSDSLARVPQATADVAKKSGPPAIAIVPVAPQQPVMPFNVPADASSGRSLSGTALIPQVDLDAIGSPIGRVPRSVENLGSAALSGDEDERMNREDAAVNLSLGGSTDNAISEVSSAAGEVHRAALLGNLQLNIEAVDQALDAMANEIERLGGELAMWFDDWSVSSWGTAATAVAAFGLGGRYIWRARGRRSLQEDSEEESSSWLFTRLQSPAGQP
jgi:hypothetical protein